jgi:predicted RNA-binding Zn ribbon-like protein
LTEPESGGSPALGEPLAIEFANTTYAVRGVVREGLAKPEHLTRWLRDHTAADLTVGPAELARFVRLRDAIREIAQAVVDDVPPEAEPLDTLNAAAALAPRWPRLDQALRTSEHSAASATDATLAAIARSAVELFGGDRRGELRACGGPGCVLFFVKNHPRREYCSAGCGNRARVGRHYARHRTRERDRGVG